MRKYSLKSSLCLSLLVMLTLPAVVQAQFTFITNNGAITITGYTGTNAAVSIPDTINGLPVTSIGDKAFDGCASLTSITIGNSVTNIGDNAFSQCINLISVTIPDSVTSLGYQAFSEGYALSSIKIGTNVNSIGVRAFAGCESLTNLTIPGSVTNIGATAFSGCFSLTAITVDALNSVYSSEDGVLFDKSQTTLIQYPLGKAGAYTIPNTVTIIGFQAFSECYTLTSITIGNGVTFIDASAFLACQSLREVYFKGNAPRLGKYVFYGANPTVYYLPGTTGWSSTFGGLPTALWVLPYPVILTSAPTFGMHSNGFSFIISWATNVPVVVEASKDLGNPSWYPLATNTLTSGSIYFGDPQWTNYATRFYRIRSP